MSVNGFGCGKAFTEIVSPRELEDRTMKETVLANVDRCRGELVEFVRRLVRTPSENPPGDETEVAALIIDKMEDLGVERIEVLAKEKNRPNILGSICGSKKKPIFLVNGHIDTRPVTEEERADWIVDPYSADIIDGRLYGRGSTDMKGSVAAMIFAAGAIKEAGVDLKGALQLCMFADEETGGEFGVNWLLGEKKLSPDAALTGEPSGIDNSFEYLAIASRGAASFEVVVHGTQMHSSLSDVRGGVNAGVKLSNVISSMSRDLKLRYASSPLYPKGPTVNLGLILEAGKTRGVIPGRSKAVNEIRLIPGMTEEQVKKDVEEFLDKLRETDPQLDVEVKWTRFSPAAEISRDEPVVRTALGAAREVLGFEPKLTGFPAGCDGRQMINLAGIPTIPAFGPGLLPLAHSPNEYVLVEDIVKAAKIFALTAMGYLA